MKQFQKGTKVEWKWGSGTGTGIVKDVYTDEVTKTIKHNMVTRNGSASDPAYLIEQDDGDRVLKSHSELEPA